MIALTHELLASLGLFTVGQGGIRLDGSDSGDQVRLVSDRVRVGISERRTVRAVPFESIGQGVRSMREASHVPRSGARVAGEGLVIGGLVLADHANAVTVAREVTSGGHWWFEFWGGFGIGWTWNENYCRRV